MVVLIQQRTKLGQGKWEPEETATKQEREAVLKLSWSCSKVMLNCGACDPPGQFSAGWLMPWLEA